MEDHESSSALLSASAAIFDDREYSDLIVHCNDRVWYCHRVIIFKRCPSLSEKSQEYGDGYWKLFIEHRNTHAVQQMLSYLYTFEIPDLDNLKIRDLENRRGSIWTEAFDIFSIAKEHQLETLAAAAHSILLRQASKLCNHWDQFDDEKKATRFTMATELWMKYPTREELTDLRASVLQGLVMIADKLSGYPGLNNILESSTVFMHDYVKAVSKEIGRKRKRV